MTKEQVIKIRTLLKQDKNIPVKVHINNMYRHIDESNRAQFTKWDDANGLLYVISLEDPVMKKNPGNTPKVIDVFCVPYEIIEAMEAPSMDLDNLPKLLDDISASGATITPEWKDVIIKRFDGLLNGDITTMGPTKLNEIMGIVDGNKAYNDKDDYYEGKYTNDRK